MSKLNETNEFPWIFATVCDNRGTYVLRSDPVTRLPFFFYCSYLLLYAISHRSGLFWVHRIEIFRSMLPHDSHYDIFASSFY